MTALAAALRDASDVSRVHDLHEAVNRISPGEIPAAIALARRASDEDQGTLLALLAAKWAESDPQAAANFGASMMQSWETKALKPALKVWADKDHDAAMSWARALPGASARNESLYILALSLALRDPAAGMKLILTLPVDAYTINGYIDIFKEWAAHDPATAAQQTLTLPLGQRRDVAIGKVTHEFARIDGAAAFAWVSQLPDARLRDRLVNDACQIWAGADPQGGIAGALSLPPGALRSQVLNMVWQGLGTSDPAEAMRVIGQMPAGPERSGAESVILTKWVDANPQAVAAYASALPPGETRTQALNYVAQKQAQSNAPAAPAEVGNPPNGKKIPISEVFKWAESDPRAAAEYLLKKPPTLSEGEGSRTRDPLVRTVELWHQQDPAAALAWARQVEDEKIRGSLLSELISNISRKNPQEAAALVPELPLGVQADSVRSVAGAWAEIDPAAATAWALQLPEGEIRNDAISWATSVRARRDLAATKAWITTLSAGGARDAAVGSFTKEVAKSDPQSAGALAATIADQKFRDRCLEVIAKQYLGSDHKAAAQWINASPAFSPEQKQRLLPKN